MTRHHNPLRTDPPRTVRHPDPYTDGVDHATTPHGADCDWCGSPIDRTDYAHTADGWTTTTCTPHHAQRAANR